MRISIFTIFPELIEAHLRVSILGRAHSAGLLEVVAHDLRAHAPGRHRQVDDAVFGGGPGMVFKPDVVAAALDVEGAPGRRLVLTPAGHPLDQAMLDSLATESELTLLCGRYEGVDQRVLDAYEFEPVSIGDYVIGGGELAALVVVEGVTRLLPGVMGNEASAETESHRKCLLEAPCYTRPADWRGVPVPDVLLGGDHAEIQSWRRGQSIALTARFRPDLIRRAVEQGFVTESEVERVQGADTIESRFPEETA